MLSSMLALLLNSAFLMLRLGSSGGSFPRPLSAEEERKYVALAASGDEEAKGKLIEHNLRLVAHIVKKYYSMNCDQDDLISIGTVGLIKGISSYRPDRGVRLATYASRCVENEILMYFRSQRKSAGDVSLSDALDNDGEAGLSIQDVLYEEDDILERLALKEDSRRLRRLIGTSLDDREREIVSLRYGLGGCPALPQREVAARLGISRSYVSRLEKRALEKLRQGMETGGRD
ncbi:MAG: RNA polymerase sporulation sigma factor SigK [Oscillospiraceae bacterium]|nr:RNA polymerase sporulation sigma factor SigK [Oscillospiraceae bacterium]